MFTAASSTAGNVTATSSMIDVQVLGRIDEQAQAWRDAKNKLRKHEAALPPDGQACNTTAGACIGKLHRWAAALQQDHASTPDKGARDMERHNADLMRQLTRIIKTAEQGIEAIRNDPQHLGDKKAAWTVEHERLRRLTHGARRILNSETCPWWQVLVDKAETEMVHVPSTILRSLPTKLTYTSGSQKHLVVDYSGNQQVIIRIQRYQPATGVASQIDDVRDEDTWKSLRSFLHQTENVSSTLGRPRGGQDWQRLLIIRVPLE